MLTSANCPGLCLSRRTQSITFDLPPCLQRRSAAIVLLLALLAVTPSGALGATVMYKLAPDSHFGSGGQTIIDLGSRYEEGRAMAAQPDGKVVIVGKTNSVDGPLLRSAGGGRISATCYEETPGVPSRVDFVVARFTADGNLDPGFGTGGKVLTDLGAEDEAEAVAVQPDGKIVVAGITYTSYYAVTHGVTPFRKVALVRYNADGTLDSSFGGGGVLVTNFTPGGTPAALAVSDGKIIITRPDFALTRFNGDGSLDTTFGNGGTAAPHFSDSDRVLALAARPDKKIVAVGSAMVNGKSVFAVALFHGDGSLDTAFGNGGVSLSALPNSSGATSVMLQPDGKVVVGGWVYYPANFNGYSDFAVARYDAGGGLDAGFGSNGFASAPAGETSCGVICGPSALALQPNGKILAVGRRLVARFNRSGSPNASFGNFGVSALGPFDQFTGVIAQSDDRIVLAGGVTSPIPNVLFTDKTCGNGNLLLSRYKVVVEVIDDGDPVGDDGIPIDAPDVVRAYAPLVFLHSEETYKPADASIYIMNSDLIWSHQAAPPQTDCPDHLVASWGTVDESRLGDPAYQFGVAADVAPPPYSHNVRSFLSCGDGPRLLTTRDRTRPFDGAQRHNVLASDTYLREGFYLDPFNSDLFRQGFPNKSAQPESEYAGAPVYYEYVPKQYVTYWFFYAYNSFDGQGPLNEKHEGDWEQVSIHLDCEDKPIEIAYYKHGGADPYPWPSAGAVVPVNSDAMALAGTHPIVFSAVGSHASYPTAGEQPGLDLYQSDHTNAGLAWRTWRSLKPVKKQAWYGYGGAWGEVGALKYFTGPLGPSIYKEAYPKYWRVCGSQQGAGQKIDPANRKRAGVKK